MLAKVNSSGAVTSMGYFGGFGDDRATAAAVDGSGEVYFTGSTTSAQFFPVASAYSGYKGGQDAFIAKLSGDGRTLRYSTYLGGTGGVPGQGETGNWIGVDATGAATIVGTTGSSDFPVTASPVQPVFGGGATDAFIAKLSAAGNALLYSSFLGGNSTEEGLTGAYGSDGAFYVGGVTASAGLPTPEALQSTIGGDIDGFFAKLNGSLGSRLAFSYAGGTGIEAVTGLSATATGLIVAGNSSSTSWLASGTPKGLYDGWVMAVAESGLAIQMHSTPPGMALTVSGTGCTPTSATTPATLAWRSGSSCAVSFAGTQGSVETRYVFQSWHDGSTSNPRTFSASAAATYNMNFITEHRLTRTASPSGAGAVSAADGFYAAASPVTLTATANTGYEFAGWSGSVTSSVNPLALTMNGPIAVTANFKVRTTFTSSLAVQLTITGSGCAAGTYTTPATVAMTSGAACSVSFSGTQTSGGVRSVFSRWSDGPTSNPRNITANAPATYSLEWNTEYLLTRLTTGSGSVSGSDGYYAASATLQLTATAVTGHQFVNWSGAATGTANPLSVVMNAPKTITANFALRTATVNIGSNVAGVQFSLSGTGCAAATHTAPASLTWAEGLSCTVTTLAIQGGDTRWVFERWADGNASNSRTVTATAPSVSYTLQFATEHRLTRLVSGSGTVSGADGFYAAGSTISLTATPAQGYQFTSWSGAGSSTAHPLVVTMSAPVAVTANFSTAPTAVAIGANVAGAQFSISGSGCPAGTYTAPAQVTWTNGTACSVTATSPQGGLDTRLVFTRWADGSIANPRSITAQPGASASLVFTTEHKLTRTVSGQGSVSGTDVFYAAGSAVSLTATPVTGYQFAGWSGGASGTSNPVSLTMSGPMAVTATFTPAPVAVRIEANTATTINVSGAGCMTATYTAPITLTWTNGTAA